MQGCSAQTKNFLKDSHTTNSVQETAQEAIIPGWASNGWTASDNPYNQIITKTDQLAAQGLLNRKSVSAAVDVAQGTNDPVKIADVAYQQYRFMRVTFPQDYQELNPVLALLKQAPNPHAYQFSRIAFLVSGYYPPTHAPWLTTLGDRLLQRDPTDADLVYARVRAGLPFLSSPLEKKKLLGYANRLIVAHPHDLTAYYALEIIYDVSFTSNVRGNRADGIMTLGILKKMEGMEQEPTRLAWDINEAKTNQTLLDETAGPPPPDHGSRILGTK